MRWGLFPPLFPLLNPLRRRTTGVHQGREMVLGKQQDLGINAASSALQGACGHR